MFAGHATTPGSQLSAQILLAVLVTMTIASVIVAGHMFSLASREAEERTKAEVAKKAAESSFARASEAERLARSAEEQGRKLLYTTNMQLAPFVSRDARSTAEQLRLLLARHVPDVKPAADTGVTAAPTKSNCAASSGTTPAPAGKDAAVLWGTVRRLSMVLSPPTACW